jgi:AcrR family transcriptional regulator
MPSRRTLRSSVPAATKGGKTKERIVDRALALASSEGLAGVSIGALAESVGMSKGGLFAHFDSKEDLHLHVLEAAVTRFRADVVEPVRDEAPGVPRLRALLDRWIAWDGDDRLPGGCPFVGFAAELDEQPGGARDALVEAQRRWMTFLGTLVSEGVEAGDLHPGTDVALFAFLTHGILLSYHQASHLLRSPAARANAERGLETLLEAHAPAARTAQRRSPAGRRR